MLEETQESLEEEIDVLSDISTEEIDEFFKEYSLSEDEKKKKEVTQLKEKEEKEKKEFEKRIREEEYKEFENNKRLQKEIIENFFTTSQKNIKKFLAWKNENNTKQISEEEEKNYQIAREEIMKYNSKIWKTKFLPNFRNIILREKSDDTRKELLSVWESGVPSCVRGKCWTQSVDITTASVVYEKENVLLSSKITQKNYEHHKKILKKYLSAITTTTNNKNVFTGSVIIDTETDKMMKDIINMVECDLNRTFTTLKLFQRYSPLHDQVLNVVIVFSMMFPEMSYVQGMCYLACCIVLNVEDEFDCFKMLSKILMSKSKFHFNSVFKLKNKIYLDFYSNIVGILLREYDKDLFTYLMSHNINFEIFMLDWVLTLYTKSFPLNISCRIWDLFFMPSSSFFILFKSCISILIFHSKVLQTMSYENLLYYLTHIDEIGSYFQKNNMEDMKFKIISERSLFDVFHFLPMQKKDVRKARDISFLAIKNAYKFNPNSLNSSFSQTIEIDNNFI